MQVGDKVQVTGTVRDIVDESVLMVTDDGREYWHLKQHVSLQSALTEAEAASAAAAAGGTATTPAPATPGAIKSFPPIKSAAELESMTKAELEAYGKKLGVHLDDSMTKAEMIDDIENAAKPK